MRQLVDKARIDHGITTAGALLDFLNGLDAPGRRALLDEARQECALPSLEELEIAERAEATIRRGTGAAHAAMRSRRLPKRTHKIGRLVRPRRQALVVSRARTPRPNPATSNLPLGGSGSARPASRSPSTPSRKPPNATAKKPAADGSQHRPRSARSKPPKPARPSKPPRRPPGARSRRTCEESPHDRDV